MNCKKIKIGTGIAIIFVIIVILFLWRAITFEGNRDLGYLSDPCTNEYKIYISHYAEFDDKQPLSFFIKKNDKLIENVGGCFAVTNDMNESIDNFDINCYDNIVYVTDKNGTYVYIMFDIINMYVYPYNNKGNSYNEDKFKKYLFDKIKKGNLKIEIE